MPLQFPAFAVLLNLLSNLSRGGDALDLYFKSFAMDLESQSFLNYLSTWITDLPSINIDKAIPDPEHSAIVSVDVTNGFCYQGPLASPRVASIVGPIARLFQRAWEKGLNNIVLIQDSHEPDAVEFAQWPPHCVRGTPEAETVPELKALPFFNGMVVIPKNSIQSALNTSFNEWQLAHPDIGTYIVTGDCTDLCTYQLAMHLRLQANANQVSHHIILPVNCTDTYDLPVEAALTMGAIPHPGNLINQIFLYHMMLNGVEIYKEIN
jgi:nicotinamidase-related amidase